MTSAHRPVLFSGIQPSGTLTLGNYIGAIRNWVDLQDDYDSLFSLVDLHAITVRQEPAALRQRCREFLALYLACGIDPNRSTVFVQSQVPQHTQMAWLLNCYTYVGELNRMTQFKDKSQKHADNINAGLYSYPVLMAADILLYQTELVPVGEDQKQHLELTRDLAIRLNSTYQKEVGGDLFTVPEPFIPKVGARIMGLQTPTAKMSKSDDAETNYIALLDEPKRIERKIKRAVTDSEGGVYFDQENKPGVANLMTIYAAMTNKSIDEVTDEFDGQGYGPFKGRVAESVIEFLEPVQQRYQEITGDAAYLDDLMRSGAEQASAKAQDALDKLSNALGLIPAA